jgi:hypothetical protein
MNAMISSINFQFALPAVFVFLVALGLFVSYFKQRNH